MVTTKRSRQREAILEVIKNTKCHPTADWVYSEVRKLIPNISLGTVYRNLSMLSENGTIQKLNIGTTVEHFDGNPMPHYHVCCNVCGGIDDIEAEPLEEFNRWAAERFNGEIYEHHTMFVGRCSKCKNIKD